MCRGISCMVGLLKKYTVIMYVYLWWVLMQRWIWQKNKVYISLNVFLMATCAEMEAAQVGLSGGHNILLTYTCFWWVLVQRWKRHR